MEEPADGVVNDEEAVKLLEDGEIRRFVNLFLNGEDIRFQDGKATKVSDGDELSVIPAIAGGKR